MWDHALIETLGLSLKVSLVATIFSMVIGGSVSFWIVRRGGLMPRLIELVLSLSLVVPPVATGYCLLLLLGPKGPLGRWFELIGLHFAFSWHGAAVASAVMALPVFIAIAKVAFQNCDVGLEDAARTLNADPLRAFFTITLPLAMPGLLAAAAVSFARAFGEFGATMMLAGNIPGRTRTVPQAIYTNLLAGNDRAVWILIVISIAVGVTSMVASLLLTRGKLYGTVRRQRSA